MYDSYKKIRRIKKQLPLQGLPCLTEAVLVHNIKNTLFCVINHAGFSDNINFNLSWIF